MKMSFVVFLLAPLLIQPAKAQTDERLYGTWHPVTYEVAGRPTPVEGLMVITKGYFIGNITFDQDGDGVLEANANCGPISVEDGRIKIVQWMQLHWRENDPEGNFLAEGVPEEVEYTIEDERLVFHFPSGNRYISERLE